MTNQAAIDLFTQAFASGSLVHPGDENTPSRVIPIPGFRATGMSDEQAQELIGQAAKLWAEALAHHVEANGKTIIDTTELAQLRQDAADAPDGTRVITLHRGNTTTPALLAITVGKTDQVAIPDAALRALGADQ